MVRGHLKVTGTAISSCPFMPVTASFLASSRAPALKATLFVQ